MRRQGDNAGHGPRTGRTEEAGGGIARVIYTVRHSLQRALQSPPSGPAGGGEGRTICTTFGASAIGLPLYKRNRPRHDSAGRPGDIGGTPIHLLAQRDRRAQEGEANIGV